MQYGICHLSIVPLRIDPSDNSEMVSQLLYGEPFKVLEKREKWSRIRIAFDSYEGWVTNNQFLLISEFDYLDFEGKEEILSADLIEFITNGGKNLVPIPLGSLLSHVSFLGHHHDGNIRKGRMDKSSLIKTAFLYLNAPYLWGGKTPFGIDCSGFTQMVYRLNGYKLFRDSAQQAGQGESLSFIEECEPGDLAFFDDRDGNINHVGIMMKDNYIIHAHGMVRIDRIDHSGIYNVEIGKHTHKLRVIKKII